MNIYFYDEGTGEYTGTAEAFLDPEETRACGRAVYLMPPNATTEKPAARSGYAAVWNGEKWTNVQDKRGTMYWPAGAVYGDAPVEHKALGPLPKGAMLEPPEEPLEEMRSRKLEALTAAHEAWRDNSAYFFSSLGFPADGKTATVTDLSLLFAMSQAVGAGYTARFMDYENAEHTLDAEGLRTLYAEEGLARNAGYYQKWQIRDAINAAKTAAELDAIAIDFTPADFRSQ